MSLSSRSKSFSAPVPLTLGTTDKKRPLGSSRGSQRSDKQKLGDNVTETTAGMVSYFSIVLFTRYSTIIETFTTLNTIVNTCE